MESLKGFDAQVGWRAQTWSAVAGCFLGIALGLVHIMLTCVALSKLAVEDYLQAPAMLSERIRQPLVAVVNRLSSTGLQALPVRQEISRDLRTMAGILPMSCARLQKGALVTWFTAHDRDARLMASFLLRLADAAERPGNETREDILFGLFALRDGIERNGLFEVNALLLD